MEKDLEYAHLCLVQHMVDIGLYPSHQTIISLMFNSGHDWYVFNPPPDQFKISDVLYILNMIHYICSTLYLQ